MSAVEAIVQILTALALFAWPVAVVSTALIFRKELKIILGRLRNAKLPGGGELSFERAVAKADEDFASPPPDNAPRALPPAEIEETVASQPFDRQHFARLAMTSPEAAIALAFREVESELMKALNADQFISPRRAVAELRARGRLDHRDEALLLDLVDLRNRVLHHKVDDVSYSSVIVYLRLIEDFLRRIRPREVTILDNAVIAGAFPPNGPWKRSGKPPLRDGLHRIVRYADKTWRLEHDPNIVVFEPAFPNPPQ